MSRIKRLAKKLTISAGALLVAAIALELVLRAQEPGPFSFFDRNPYVESEPDIHVRHQPGFTGRWDSTWYEIDERGFRGKTAPLSFSDEELRVVCLGDSCTFGKGGLETDTWPRQLESLMHERGRDGAVVMNLGINGGHARVYRQMLEENIDELKPQLILVGFNINDFPNTIRAVDEKVFQNRKLRTIMPQWLRDGFGRLALYRKARAIYYDMQKERDWKASEATAAKTAELAKAGEVGADPANDKVWALQRQYLTSIRELADAQGAEVYIFLFPYETQLYLDTFDRTPIDTLSKVCADLDLPFFDLTERFREVVRSEDAPKTLFIQGDRYHPNAAGYGLVAEVVMAELVAEAAAGFIMDPIPQQK